MIKFIRQGDLLTQPVEAIVNTVNCVGIMGKGIALQIKRKWPENYKAYVSACKRGEVVPGKMFIYDYGFIQKAPRFIVNFPTKRHWKAKSRLEDIDSGLIDLVKFIKTNDIKSIAIPPLGCGNGGLDWSVVRPRIENALQNLSGINIQIFEPQGTNEVRTLSKDSSLPLTSSRASMLKLFDLYKRVSSQLGRIEAMKLVYFLQVSGEPFNLKFKKHIYGPYADSLRHILQKMDGTYLIGVGDGSRSDISLAHGILADVDNYLNHSKHTQNNLSRVSRLIEGFETPYGMELLATVHWVMHETKPEPSLLGNDEEIVIAVQAWNLRKRRIMPPNDIRLAACRLRELGW